MENCSFLNSSQLAAELSEFAFNLSEQGYDPEQVEAATDELLRQLIIGCDEVGEDGGTMIKYSMIAEPSLS